MYSLPKVSITGIKELIEPPENRFLMLSVHLKTLTCKIVDDPGVEFSDTTAVKGKSNFCRSKSEILAFENISYDYYKT